MNPFNDEFIPGLIVGVILMAIIFLFAVVPTVNDTIEENKQDGYKQGVIDCHSGKSQAVIDTTSYIIIHK